MPIETQSQIAKEAVKGVASEISKTRKDARVRRAAEHTANWASQQTNPDHGLRALATGEREGLRQGKDWKTAKDRADTWRQRAKEKPLRFWESKNDTNWGRVGELQAQGLDINAATAQASKEQQSRLTRSEVKAANREVDAFKGQYADAIAAEHSRLITAEVQKKGSALTTEDLQNLRLDEQALVNVKAAAEFEQAQQEKVRDEVTKSPEVKRVILDRIAEEQGKKRGALSEKEIADIETGVIDQYTERAMEGVRDREGKRMAEQQALIDHPDYADKFADALTKMGVTVDSASEDQLKKAQQEALTETKVIKDAEDNAADLAYDQEIQDLRQEDEWQKAYNRVLSRELARGGKLTPEAREELREVADRLVKTDAANAEWTVTKETLADKQQKKADIDERIKIIDLQEKVRAAAEKAAGNPASKSLERGVKAAEGNLTAELGKYTKAAEAARKASDANPSDTALSDKADLLEARAAEFTDFSKTLNGNTKVQLEGAMATEKSNQEAAQAEVVKANNAANQAELKVALFGDPSLDLREISKMDLSNLPTGAAEKIMKAYDKETGEEQIAVITELKDKAEKDKKKNATLIALLATILISFGAAAVETTQKEMKNTVTS